MTPQTKIATCCYCGTRAALVLRGRDRHELACSACGAPLHNLKHMPAPAPQRRSKPDAKPSHSYGAPKQSYSKPSKSYKKPKKSKRKKRFGDFFEDAFELIEDIFD